VQQNYIIGDAFIASFVTQLIDTTYLGISFAFNTSGLNALQNYKPFHIQSKNISSGLLQLSTVPASTFSFAVWRKPVLISAGKRASLKGVVFLSQS